MEGSYLRDVRVSARVDGSHLREVRFAMKVDGFHLLEVRVLRAIRSTPGGEGPTSDEDPS